MTSKNLWTRLWIVPLMLSLDFGLNPQQVLVWFGILVLVSVEVGMISPPFGMNLFVINAMARTCRWARPIAASPASSPRTSCASRC